MKQVLISQGSVLVEEVPIPTAAPGSILVDVAFSCISAGTELSGLRHSGKSVWERALARPQKVQEVLRSAAEIGISDTLTSIKGKLSARVPFGYSTAGTVREIGEGVTTFKVGQRVACAGAQCAHHAATICVPVNLAVHVPANVPLQDASTVALGAIALQGIRRAQPTLGETFVVIGLGLLGQLTVQILRANGCKVIGLDVDSNRANKAIQHGMDSAIGIEESDVVAAALRQNGGVGVDGVVITASSPSSEIVSNAFRMCRRKGRVVLVGDVGLELDRNDFYANEIDFLISSSYGPGRYDENYEARGLDYPLAYVRWTENRNMRSYLELLGAGRVRLQLLGSKTYDVQDASQAYEELQRNPGESLLFHLSYSGSSQAPEPPVTPSLAANTVNKVRIAVVGAGGFARGMHLPNLRRLPDLYSTHAIMSRTAHNAHSVQREFKAVYATADYHKIIEDDHVDAVLITSRHDSHAEMTLAALKAGKHVLVEKPLALNENELSAIERFLMSGSKHPLLLTGFNRRFSPLVRRLAPFTLRRQNPLVISYRMNVGYLPASHWVHGPAGGGRNIGEACHIYDLFTFLTGGRVVGVQATSISPVEQTYGPQDNFSATVSFADGSIATLTYVAMGSTKLPKERMEVFWDGKSAVLDDYVSLRCYGFQGPEITLKTQDKGHYDELQAFGEAVLQQGKWPIELWEQLQAMRIAFAVEKQIFQ
jgi:predicted dehydrogenase/threonine dehydrogenase-like Zn-dependent dehydrogenase